MSQSFLSPPLPKNDSGKIRRIGFEIEFAAEDCAEVAGRVRSLYGGELKKINPHFYEIRETRLGTFVVHLDTQIAHPESSGDPENKENDWWDIFDIELKEKVCQFIGDLSKVVVPYEVVTPPIPMDHLESLPSLIDELRKLGAQGTDESFFYAFGVHINPEVPSFAVESLRDHLRAFLLLSDWLHEEMGIDIARKASPYINSFPDSYCVKILSPEYNPDLTGFIDDYLLDNPTRNRELDMLPLLTHLDKNRVQNQVEDNLTSSRPTFHYRLPDCRLNDPDWSLAREWNYWVQVERLAANSSLLREMSLVYLENDLKFLPDDWAGEIRKRMFQK